MNLSLILFLIGILGFVLNRKNIILMLISIEIMLLAITFLILVSSLSFDDILVQLDNMNNIHPYISGEELYLTTRIMYLALIILPLLGSIVFGFLGRKVEISRAQLIYAFIIVFIYIINIYLNKTYFVSIDLTIVINLALLIGAIAGISQIILELENRKFFILQVTSLIIVAIYLLILTIPLGYCSTPLLLCLLIGAVTAVFTCSIELYNKTLKTKAIKIYSFIVIVSIYLDYDIWVDNLNSINNFFLLMLNLSTFYTLYLLTTNTHINSENFLKKICKILFNFIENPSLFILLAGVSFLSSYQIRSIYLSLIYSFNMKIFTYLVIMFPIWLPICYSIYILRQILALYWLIIPCNVIPLNVNIFKLPLDFSFKSVKKQINVSNALFLCINSYLIFSFKSLSFIYCNFNPEIWKSYITNLEDPQFKISNVEKLSDGSNPIETNELLTPKFNKITMDELRLLVNDTYVKFSGLNKLNKFNFKPEIIYNAKLNTLNNLLIKNVSSVEFYSQTIDHLAKVNQFYKYVLYLTERKIPSWEVSFDEIDGTPAIRHDVCKDIINFRTSLKTLFENKEFSRLINYNWKINNWIFISDYEWVNDIKTDLTRNNFLTEICYGRLQDSILFMGNTKLNKAFYLVESSKLVSYNSYFSSVFESNNNRIYYCENYPSFFKASLTNTLKKTLPHQPGLR